MRKIGRCVNLVESISCGCADPRLALVDRRVAGVASLKASETGEMSRRFPDNLLKRA